MNNRLFAILIVVCLAVAGAGCGSEGQRRGQVILLPRQTGSNLNRRITLDDEGSLRPVKRSESKRPAKKGVKTARTEPARAQPEQPEETPPPDRFR